MTITAKRSAAITVKGLTGFWANMTGGDTSAAATENWNGGSKVAAITTARPVISSITVTRPFDPATDREMCRTLRKLVGSSRYTITRQDTDDNDMKIGSPEVFSNCLLTKVATPDYDATASAAGVVSLEFKPQAVS